MNRFETVSQEENMDWSTVVKIKGKVRIMKRLKTIRNRERKLQKFIISIDYVCNKTRSRVEINFKNIHEANQLLDDPLLEANKLKAFIPSFRLIRRGIIKGVDEDISEEEMLEEMESHQRILGIRRLNRRNRDPNRQENDPKWVPSKSVIITFSGQNLPSEVRLYKIKIEVDPYMTLPIVCYNCFKLGHTSLNCRNETKCSMCGENKHQESCGTSCPKCSNCKGEHIATDRNCPIYRMEYEVKRLMAYENLVMGDARKLVFHSPPKKRLKPGPEEFPNFQSTAYSTYSEVVKDRRSLPTVPRKPQEKPNNFYKAQMENCENFIGSRESINSANRVAMGQGSSGKKTIQTNKDQPNKTNKSAKTEDHLQLIQNVRGQRVILKDLSNKPEYTMMKKEVQVKVTPPNNSLKTIRTYQKSAKRIKSHLEQQVGTISNYLAAKNLYLAPEKCKLVIFNRLNLNTNNFHININNTIIEPSPYAKFLGIILDKRLNWNLHISHIIKKCDIPIRILSCIRGTWWGADPVTMLTLYNSLIRSRIEYGGFLISPCKPELLEKIEKVQYKCLRLAMGYRKSTPTNIILSESKILSLARRFDTSCYKFLNKNMASNNTALLEIIEEINEMSENFIYENNFEKSSLISKFEETLFYTNIIYKSEIPTYYQLDFKNQFELTNIDISSGEELKESNDAEGLFTKIFQEKISNKIAIFTDGSRSVIGDKSYVGMANWCSNDQFTASFKLFDHASIFSAEAMAILKALKTINESELSSFIIFSDSMSVLKALSNRRKLRNQNHIIQEIKHLLSVNKKRNKDIELIWIPSHSNIEGNENADALAKNAAQEGPFLNQELPYSDIANVFKLKCKKENDCDVINRAQTQGKGAFYFEQYFAPNSKPWFFKTKLSRRAIVSVNRIRCGHNSLKSSLARFNIINSDLCSCGSPEDINHVFWECKKFEEERKTMVKKFKKLRLRPPIDIREVLKRLKREKIEIITEFIFSCKIDI
ncbi:uncharacterized protein LOC114946237 [Nylanderia fulva]|uniref:uncharacterized protein LOC114946237 n=1 Tax=Nylanderia fulva TaxID=613905 RepID=UPI0010FB3E4B|nr:uncharacterized protein LOC114946237 [Nylanderia fulva]